MDCGGERANKSREYICNRQTDTHRQARRQRTNQRLIKKKKSVRHQDHAHSVYASYPTTYCVTTDGGHVARSRVRGEHRAGNGNIGAATNGR